MKVCIIYWGVMQLHQSWHWLAHPVWRQNISSRTCILTRRNEGDADFLRLLWATPEFIDSFHPLHVPLPDADEALKAVLRNEFLSTLDRSNSIHWVIRSPDWRPWGLLSLCQISLQNRRAEVMLGVLPGSPFGLSVASMLMLFIFYFKSIGFNKLCSLVFAGNDRSLASTMSLGARGEGFMKSHFFDKKTGAYVDVHQLAWLAADAFSPRNRNLMSRLL